jgi:plasmid stabilization system protein ParE
MTYRVVFQPQADRDIQQAARWLRDQSASLPIALRWVRSLRAKIDQLKTNPRRCPIDPDSNAYGEEVRVLLYGKRRGTYRVLFTIRGDVVYIVAVRHAAQRSWGEEIGEKGSDEEEIEPIN